MSQAAIILHRTMTAAWGAVRRLRHGRTAAVHGLSTFHFEHLRRPVRRMNARIVPVALLIVSIVVRPACQAVTTPAAGTTTSATSATQSEADRLVVTWTQRKPGWSIARSVLASHRHGRRCPLRRHRRDGRHHPRRGEETRRPTSFSGRMPAAPGRAGRSGSADPAARLRAGSGGAASAARPENGWGPAGARVVVYNTNELTEADLPASVLDQADPTWRGRLAWAPTNGSFQAFVTASRCADGR